MEGFNVNTLVFRISIKYFKIFAQVLKILKFSRAKCTDLFCKKL
jgi:hypothetical protein